MVPESHNLPKKSVKHAKAASPHAVQGTCNWDDFSTSPCLLKTGRNHRFGEACDAVVPLHGIPASRLRKPETIAPFAPCSQIVVLSRSKQGWLGRNALRQSPDRRYIACASIPSLQHASHILFDLQPREG